MKHIAPRVAVSVAAIAAIVCRQIWPTLFDTTSLVLVAVAFLPWLADLIKSAELPGGVKIEFQDLRDAVEKVTGESTGVAAAAASGLPTFVRVADTDSNLALVGLRIEIETRLRRLAERAGLPDRQPLFRLFHELRRRGVLNDPVLSGLQELVVFGNQAAHGAEVEPTAAQWALEFGPEVLGVLDSALTKSAP